MNTPKFERVLIKRQIFQKRKLYNTEIIIDVIVSSLWIDQQTAFQLMQQHYAKFANKKSTILNPPDNKYAWTSFLKEFFPGWYIDSRRLSFE